MTRTKDSPGSPAYYDALQKIFRLQSETLTAVLPHAGERGANDEERLRVFLNSVLPRRYSVGSGFVVSADSGSPGSRQQDVVIFDDFLNSPLHRELAAGVFPIEMVYATIEVKGLLKPSDLSKIGESIASVRRLSMECQYAMPQFDNIPGRHKMIKLKLKRPPRGFAFAFDTSYKNPDKFKLALEHALDISSGAHLHGIAVLSRDWFAFQVPNRPKAEVKLFEGNALLRYMSNMLDMLKTSVVREADMSRYLGIETAPTNKDGT